MIQAVFRGETLELIPAGVYIVDAEGVIRHYNRRATELWGRAPRTDDPAERFCGSLRMLRADGSQLPHDRCPVADVLRTGTPSPRDVEVVIERPDGSRLTVAVNVGPLHDENGKLIGAINCFQDVTEQKHVESRLRYQSELNTAITTNAAECLFLIDERGRATYLNPAAERTFGWKLEEILGRPLHDVLHEGATRDDSSRLSECQLSSVFRTGQTLRDHRDCFIRKDGSSVHVLCSNAPIISGDGRVTGAVLVAHDITELKRFEQDLLRAKEAAEAANAAKDQFLAALSHELRTPLAPVLMTATALEKDRSIPRRVRDDLALIRRNIELEARLIDDLLDLTRVARGKLELHCERVDVHLVLRETIQTCCGSDDFGNKRLTLVTDLRARSHHAWGDSARLAQVFWNLIRNAIKFTPDGGRIEIRTCNLPAGRLMISISDTGVGIEPEMLPRIFDAFEQGNRATTRRFGGLGLGLAISKALIDMHHGTIKANSEGLGKGATFTLDVPVLRVPRVKTSPPDKSQGTQRGLRILLVEDHEMTARVLERLLRGMNYNVATAGTVQHALDTARSACFDLLISDLGLPDGSGLDLMRELQQIYQIKGIALSGYGMEDDIRRSREVGFAAHLTKPVSIDKLQATINQVA